MTLNKRGVQDSMVSLADARRKIQERAQAARLRMAEAEAELTGLLTILAASDAIMDHYREQLAAIEAQEAQGQ